jgi:hypothetical protein
VTAGLGLGLGDAGEVEAGADDAAFPVGDDSGDGRVQPAASTQSTTDRTAIDTGKPRTATDRR